jgi:hypothetical protein
MMCDKCKSRLAAKAAGVTGEKPRVIFTYCPHHLVLLSTRVLPSPEGGVIEHSTGTWPITLEEAATYGAMMAPDNGSGGH